MVAIGGFKGRRTVEAVEAGDGSCPGGIGGVGIPKGRVAGDDAAGFGAQGDHVAREDGVGEGGTGAGRGAQAVDFVAGQGGMQQAELRRRSGIEVDPAAVVIQDGGVGQHDLAGAAQAQAQSGVQCDPVAVQGGRLAGYYCC